MTDSLLDSLLICETVWAGPDRKEKESRITKAGFKRYKTCLGRGGGRRICASRYPMINSFFDGAFWKFSRS